MRDSREKGAGMRDQDPPFQTLNYGCSVLQITLQKYALFHANFF